METKNESFSHRELAERLHYLEKRIAKNRSRSHSKYKPSRHQSVGHDTHRSVHSHCRSRSRSRSRSKHSGHRKSRFSNSDEYRRHHTANYTTVCRRRSRSRSVRNHSMNHRQQCKDVAQGCHDCSNTRVKRATCSSSVTSAQDSRSFALSVDRSRSRSPTRQSEFSGLTPPSDNVRTENNPSVSEITNPETEVSKNRVDDAKIIDEDSQSSVLSVVGEDVFPDSDRLVTNEEVVLPQDILELLGDEPEKSSNNGDALHEALACRWRHILQNGLSKDVLKPLLSKYEVPLNLTNLFPPKLNPEVVTILQKAQLSTDASHSEELNILGKGISAFGKTLMEIFLSEASLPGNSKDTLLSSLGDAGRIFYNLFHRISTTRRNLILLHLNKNVKDLVANSPFSEFLLGADLSEKIKAAKSLATVGKDLKATAPKTSSGSHKFVLNESGGGLQRPVSNRPQNLN